MCSFTKTCTVGAPAATQRPEKISEQEFNTMETIYKHKKWHNTQIDCKHSQADIYRNYKQKENMDTHKIQVSKQQQEIPRFVMRVGLTGC